MRPDDVCRKKTSLSVAFPSWTGRVPPRSKCGAGSGAGWLVSKVVQVRFSTIPVPPSRLKGGIWRPVQEGSFWDLPKRFLVGGLVLLLWSLVGGGLHAQTSGSSERPNVLLVMTDDQGWGDVRVHGNPEIDTPVMDRLAGEGAWFERFYVSPVCAPTRASLLTGRYHLRTGTSWVTRGLETMRPGEVTMAEVFRDAGYATGLFGKWHNGAHYPSDPTGQGFDTFFGFMAGHWNNYFDTGLTYNGQQVETEGYITDVLTDSALAFIDRHRDEPFFCYVPYNAPHGPFQVPDAYFDRYKARGLDDKNAAVYGMVENIDDNLGRLLGKLDEAGIAENTIVLFLTDNGPNGDRYNGDMRGRKGSVHEGGVRVPLFVRWPGHIAPGTVVREIAAHIDLYPTLAELTGVAMPEGPPVDGISLAPLFGDTPARWPARLLFTHHSRGDSLETLPGAVRTPRYRLVREKEEDAWALYDMVADPGQHVDVAAGHPGIVDSLSAAYDEWFASVTAEEPRRPRIPVGYEAAPLVVLPAPESYFEGQIAFKGKAGWANDWLTNWTQTEDRVWWELDVAGGGTYEVALEYIVTAENAGADVRVSAGDAHIEATVAPAHNPDPISSPDRLPRGEVYEKEWGVLEVGTLRLEPGPVRLYVEATSKPGAEALDLKAVRLRQR